MEVKLIYGTDTGNTEAVIDNYLLNQLENNDKKNFMELMNIEKTGLNFS